MRRGCRSAMLWLRPLVGCRSRHRLLGGPKSVRPHPKCTKQLRRSRGATNNCAESHPSVAGGCADVLDFEYHAGPRRSREQVALLPVIQTQGKVSGSDADT